MALIQPLVEVEVISRELLMVLPSMQVILPPTLPLPHPIIPQIPLMRAIIHLLITPPPLPTLLPLTIPLHPLPPLPHHLAQFNPQSPLPLPNSLQEQCFHPQ